jgi:signal recognition particle subunit SRP54
MAEEYTLNDYRIELHRLQQLGQEPAIAGLDTGVYAGLRVEDWPATLACIERLLDAMTPEERLQPARIGVVEIQRLAITTGTSVEEVERAVRHFKRVSDSMRRIARLSTWERIVLLCGFRRPPKA